MDYFESASSFYKAESSEAWMRVESSAKSGVFSVNHTRQAPGRQAVGHADLRWNNTNPQGQRNFSIGNRATSRISFKTSTCAPSGGSAGIRKLSCFLCMPDWRLWRRRRRRSILARRRRRFLVPALPNLRSPPRPWSVGRPATPSSPSLIISDAHVTRHSARAVH